MSNLPNITAPNNTTTNNRIYVESPDLQQGEFCIPHCVIDMVFGYVDGLIHIPETIKQSISKYNHTNPVDEKKLLLIYNLMKSRNLSTWATKDANVMSIFVDLLLCSYKSQEETIEKIMFNLIDRLTEDCIAGKTTEGKMKDMMDITMRLKQVLKELDKIPLSLNPYGSWITFEGKIMLKLNYH